MKADLYYPHATVDIMTETSNLTLRGVATPQGSATSDVLSIVTKRSVSGEAPTFTINLVYRHDWFQSITANDLVIINMCRPPETLNPVMFGLVDDVRRNNVFAETKPKRIITITGRGFCKAFVNFELGIVNEADVTTQALGNIGREVTLEGCSASKGVSTTINSFLKNYINYSFSNKKSLFDYISLNLSCEESFVLQDASTLLNYQGSSWNFLKELQNAPFNEMFWEVVQSNPTLILRQTPFNEKDWNSLIKIPIEDTEYVDDSLGRGDMETYTLYSTQCNTLLCENNPNNAFGYVPLWYPPYIKKYGMRRLDVMSLYTMYAGSADSQTVATRAMECTKLLFNWNIKNNSMYNGSLLVKGSTRYKLGTRIYLKSEDLEFYVEGITHIFNVYDSYKTQLSITRGLHPKDRFTDPWGKFENYDPNRIPHSATGSAVTKTKPGSNSKKSDPNDPTNPKNLVSGGPNVTNNPELKPTKPSPNMGLFG